MANFSSTSLLPVLSLLVIIFIGSTCADFYNEFDITWGDGRGKIINNDLLTLSLDKSSGSGFESRNEYLFGKIDMQLKLVPGNSAGTVTAYYLSSKGANWDEIDFEFLGNLSGDPYILHTNVFSQGKGNREQQFYLWFDPTAVLTLSLDKASGSGFESKNEYLFGKIDMQLKLVPSNSAGTVTAYYLSSKGANWDEIDLEFLGNLSGDPYILHTNVFSQGKGNREQQFYLWFDPTADFHTYSILWNPQRIIFSVDGTPIREFKNAESMGVAFPKDQAMRIHSSLWNADDWATRGGLVKTDWSEAPFTASYRNFKADACVVASGKSSCGGSSDGNEGWLSEELDNTKQERLRWVQKNYMIYNYCSDSKRFPQGFPPECNMA